MNPLKQLKQQNPAAKNLAGEQAVVCLSKSMEKSFLALKNPKARDAYVEAELVNGLAHQIRIIRQQRGWTQKELAQEIGTTQTTVSRLEDPSYGRYSIKTLLALAKVFDVALFVRYMPFSKFMATTWNTRPENFEASSYEEEQSSVQFYTETKGDIALSRVISETTTSYIGIKISDQKSLLGNVSSQIIPPYKVGPYEKTVPKKLLHK